ncbi:MAG: phosphatase PAP2 family protein [Bacteroidia bacterium]|nr:phosphatase PAP2 family protein [Bacteroidia bacterium]
MTKRLFVLLLLFLPVSLFSQNMDIRILRSLNSSQTLSSDKFFQFVSNSDAYLVVGIPVGMGIAGLIQHDNQLFRNACVTLAATVVCVGITNAMKYSINRERPFVTYSDITRKSFGGSPSFPSGHTSSAFATATSLSLAYPKWYIIVPTFTWASTVAYSRMDLGVHYPSDVFVGALVGAGSAYFSYAINKKLNKNSRKKPCNCPDL